jgi:choline-sulfatase
MAHHRSKRRGPGRAGGTLATLNCSGHAGRLPTVWRRLATYLGDAVLDGAVVGVLLGLGEALHAVVAGSAAGGAGLATAVATALCAMALVTVGMVLLGPLLAAALTGVGALPAMRRLRAAVREPGPARATGLVVVVLGLLGVAGLAAATYAISAAAQREFKAATAIALLVAALATGAAVAILAVVSALGAWLAPWLGRRAWLQRITRGRLALGLGVGALALAIAALLIVAKTVSPEADLTTPTTAGALGLVLVLVRGVGVARRLRGRRRTVVAAGLALTTALGLVVVGQAASARALLLADGAAAPRVLRALWQLTDRDGDGTSAMFGGADCDDGDARIRPSAREVIGNGVDDNCRGGELAADADLGPRVTAQPSPVAARPRRNVLLISIDALRADHVGAYGYPRATTPALDELAARSTRFEWAVSPSPTTRRAIPALMSGRYASALTWQARTDVVRVELGANPMLGELLKAGGYETRAIMCCTTLFDKPHGAVAGIDVVDAKAEPTYRKQKYNGHELATKATEFFAGRAAAAAPFFLWMHFIEPHNPYVAGPGAKAFGKQPIDKYDGELSFVDKQLGTILKGLRSAGLEDETVVVITADHGEEFREHGGEFHGRTVYNEVMRVPLVIHDPGAPAQVVSTPVSVVDVAPTVLGLAGLEAPAGMSGRSLAGVVALGAPAPSDRVVLGELLPDYRITGDLITGFVDGWHMIWDRTADTLQLFSLTDDPGDQAPIEHGETFEAVRARLFAEIDRSYALLPGAPQFGPPAGTKAAKGTKPPKKTGAGSGAGSATGADAAAEAGAASGSGSGSGSGSASGSASGSGSGSGSGSASSSR